MPLQYQGVLAEHEAVRTGAGVFDVSHMGRVEVSGPDAGERLRSVTTFDVTGLEPGQAHYSLYCDEGGGIADDVFVFALEGGRWMVVHNAANAEAGSARLEAAAAEVTDVTARTVMLAVQGPEAVARLAPIIGQQIIQLAPRHSLELEWRGARALVGRTGYTGEDGFECVVDLDAGAALWDELLQVGVTPAGLGARDTLRLEAALPLHGQDIDGTTNPYEAGLGWTVVLDDAANFVGREALVRLSEQRPARRLAHLRLLERGVPRAGDAVVDPAADGHAAGTLTSGTFSPTLRTGIAMSYLPRALARPGTRLEVRIRGRGVASEVVRRPFYSRPVKG
jgi:aminomethyltransferase